MQRQTTKAIETMEEITDKSQKELALIEYAGNLATTSKVASVFGIEESDELSNVLGDFKRELELVDEDGHGTEAEEKVDAIVAKYVRILSFPLTETWKQITFAHNYEVSNFGRIRNIKTKKVLKPIDRIHSKTKNQLTIGLFSGLYRKEQHTISQIVFNHFCLAPSEAQTYYNVNGFKVKNNRIGHYDGNVYNNAAYNLFRY